MNHKNENSRTYEALHRAWSSLRHNLGVVRPSSVSGMGAVPFEGGVAFRVWAPNAGRVTVCGDFNRWSRHSDPLRSESGGYWSGIVPGAGPGQRYKYVLHRRPSDLLRSDPYGREVEGAFGDTVIRPILAQDQDQAPPWLSPWNEMVIYELHIGTFNGATADRPGTFDAAAEKLPYLAELGINAVEIMPLAEFAGDYSWGYNPAHPFAVTRAYGGPDAFRRLVDAAHTQGIAVILDVVFNHFGPQDLDLWQFDGWQQDGKGGIYFYNDWRSQTPWADTRPDYGRLPVRQYIRDNALMWFDEYQVDGLRWDATAYIRNVHGNEGDSGADLADGWGLMRWVNDEIDARRPWSLNIAEDLRNNAAITQPTSNGGAGFDAQWDAQFVHPIRAAIIAAGDEQRDIAAVAGAIMARYEGDAFNRVVYTESHDEVANGKARVPEEIDPGSGSSLYARQRSTLGAALVFTVPGIPMLFQGQEFLEGGWFDDHDPLDWSKAETYAGILALYRELIRLRRSVDGRTRGLTGQHVAISNLDPNARLIAFHRWEFGGPGDDVLVVANFANALREGYNVAFPRDGLWRLRFNSGDQRYDAGFAGTAAADVTAADRHAAIAIGPYSVHIYSQDE